MKEKGIYVLDNDTLTICDNAPNLDKGRPLAFEANKASGYVVITFKRGTNDPPSSAGALA